MGCCLVVVVVVVECCFISKNIIVSQFVTVRCVLPQRNGHFCRKRSFRLNETESLFLGSACRSGHGCAPRCRPSRTVCVFLFSAISLGRKVRGRRGTLSIRRVCDEFLRTPGRASLSHRLRFSVFVDQPRSSMAWQAWHFEHLTCGRVSSLSHRLRFPFSEISLGRKVRGRHGTLSI